MSHAPNLTPPEGPIYRLLGVKGVKVLGPIYYIGALYSIYRCSGDPYIIYRWAGIVVYVTCSKVDRGGEHESSCISHHFKLTPPEGLIYYIEC